MEDNNLAHLQALLSEDLIEKEADQNTSNTSVSTTVPAILTNLPERQAASEGIFTIREEMTRSFTYHLAALYIISANFPKKGALPSLVPPPFTNFGHQVLLDYRLLLKIVWQVVDEIQLKLSSMPKRKPIWIVWGFIVGLLVFTLLAGASGARDSGSILLFSIFLGFMVWSIGGNNSKEQKKAVADIRARAVEQLLNGEFQLWSKASQYKIDNLKLVGDGALNSNRSPVLIVLNNQRPFPGYGRLQAENTFTCRPPKDESEESTPPTIEEIRSLVSKRVANAISRNEQQNVDFGEVVVVHGNSLCIDSPWLDSDKAPPLWLDRNLLANVELIDKRASVRTYLAAQVLLPQYMTTAVFFIRPFIASGSASCQIAVATLGPLAYGTDYLNRRLLRHRMEEDEAIKKFANEARNTSTKKDEPSLATQQLRVLRALGQIDQNFQADLNLLEIEKLSLYDKDRDDDYSEQLKKVVEESVMWPGYLTAVENLREANSLTFTNDFFGKTEAISSVKTLYDRIARAVLDSFDTLGFDISDYRDSEGNYSINAEKIDQLVLGERIQITQTEEIKIEKTKSEQSNPIQEPSKETSQ